MPDSEYLWTLGVLAVWLALTWKKTSIKIHTQIYAIFGVETSIVDEINTATNHISRCKCRAIWLTSSRGAEGMTVITVVTIGMLVPTWNYISHWTLYFWLSKSIYDLVCLNQCFLKVEGGRGVGGRVTFKYNWVKLAILCLLPLW